MGRLRPADLFVLLGLLLLTAGLFGLITWRVIFRPDPPDQFDYPFHLAEAEQMEVTGRLSLPHFLFQALVIGARRAIPFSVLRAFGLETMGYQAAGWVVIVGCMLLLSLSLYAPFRRSLGQAVSAGGLALGGLAALALMLVTPINLYTFGTGALYLGYVGINVYHNPTIIVLKPLALLLFWLVARQTPLAAGRLAPVVLGAGLAVLSGLAKPNYSLCLVPALAGWCALRWVRRQPVNWSFVLLGVFVPIGLLLAWQFWQQYQLKASSQIAFAPLEVMGFFARPIELAPKFLLSVLFPLTVAAVFFKPAWADNRLRLAWLQFGFGAGLTYLFAERGPLAAHGNFLWSGQIALFVLFAASAWFLFDRLKAQTPQEWRRRSWPAVVCLTVFGLHLASGIIYYNAVLTSGYL